MKLALMLFAALAASAADIPRSPDGKPDFSGIWQTLSGAEDGLEPRLGSKDAPPSAGVVEGGSIPYQSWALTQRAKNLASRAKTDPREQCFTLGVPRGFYGGGPFQIFQRPRDLTVLYGFGHPVRTIHTNGTEHPDGHIDFWLGDSRAKWEGDTLVVDVVDFNGETWLDRTGNFHSDELHLVESWNYVDPNTIRYRATFEDPKVYTKPWSIELLFYRRLEKNVQVIENYCATLEYSKYYPYPADERSKK